MVPDHVYNTPGKNKQTKIKSTGGKEEKMVEKK